MVLRLDEDGSEDAYVNTAAGANYINASYVNVCGSTVLFRSVQLFPIYCFRAIVVATLLS